MYCTKCGREIESGQFCTYCGSPIDQPLDSNPEKNDVVPEAQSAEDINVDLPAEESAPTADSEPAPVAAPAPVAEPAPAPAPAAPQYAPAPGQPPVAPQYAPAPGQPPVAPQYAPAPGQPYAAPQYTPAPGQPYAAPAPQGNPAKSTVKVQVNNEEPKKKKSGGKGFLTFIISIVLIAALAFGGYEIYKRYFVKPTPATPGDVTLSEFDADIRYLVSGHSETVTFSVKSSSAVSEITLCGADDTYKMNDSGADGDDIAGDNVYTCRVELTMSSGDISNTSYYCEYEDVKTEEIEIYCFPELTESEAYDAMNDYQDIAYGIQNIEYNYENSDGYIPVENYEEVTNEVVSLLEEYKNDGVVLLYEVEENQIFIKMTSGLSMIYAPKSPETDAIGQDVSMTVMTMQPCFTDMGGIDFGAGYDLGYSLPSDVAYALDMMDASGRKLKNTLPNYRFPNSANCDDEEVTLEQIRSIGSNQVVLWHGHGYYGPIVHSCLVTGEDFDWEAWWLDADYFIDCVTNRIINSMFTGYDKAIISSGYIKKYCGDMTNSFIYLAACDSGRHSGLANAFTSKGAVVVANTKSILRVYNVAMLYGTVDQMLTIDPETGTFYTLEKALANAKAIYGESDADSRYGSYGNGATPKIFGGDRANNYRFAEEVPKGIVSGKVCMASDRTTPISGATIEVLIGGETYITVTADSYGQYEIELPVGDCEINITASGYIGFTSYQTITANDMTYMETFLMVYGSEESYGTASGRLINSLSGTGVSDAQIYFFKNWNNIGELSEAVAQVYTDYYGDYSIYLNCGNYTAVAVKNGYIKSSFNIIVQSGTTSNQNGTITPEISGNDYLITLTWGTNPSDLDSHLEGYTPGGSSFHVYYSDKNAYYDGDIVCSLDYDDTTSYGPEHITLKADSTKPYYYYIHHYSGSGSIATSGAKITIEQGGVVIAEYYAPTNLGTSIYWNVFAIVDGEIITRNTITYSPDTSYAN